MQKKFDLKNILQILIALALVYCVFLINSKPADLPTADLGRHIMNGKIIIASFLSGDYQVLKAIFHNNLYSYTQPEHGFVNHHWLSGVFYYLVEKYSSLSFLTFLNVLMIALANFFFFRSAQLLSSTSLALFVTTISIPITCIRSEVRPETISYLLLGILVYYLVLFDQKKISFKHLLIAALIIQGFWINFHIFFFLGLFSMFCFGIKYLVEKDSARIKQFLILGLVSTLVSLLNPHGLAGLFYPLNIFDGYGYMTAENQTVFFMQKRSPYALGYYYYEILCLLGLVSSVINRKKLNIALVIIAACFVILGLKTNRAMTLGALALVPLLAYNFSSIFNQLKQNSYKILVLTLVFLSLFIGFYGFGVKKTVLGFKFNPDVNQTAEFFKRNNIQGPIFNNFDIGGYLIYHLFPQRRVFVDNRPEAFSEEFMQDVYLKALKDEVAWLALDKEMEFNVIFFYRHDMTEHGQPFLIRRIDDPRWIPVAVDASNIILLKDNARNQELIKRYQLPQSMFRAVKTS